MNFQNLPTTMTYQGYLETALSQARKEAGRLNRAKNPIEHEKTRSLVILGTTRDVLTSHFDTLLTKYPKIDSLPPFYGELMDATVDKLKLKKALSSLSWAKSKLKDMSEVYSKSIKKSLSKERAQNQLRSFIGRTSSIVKRLSPHLEVIEASRRAMRKFPDIKEEFTVCIVGFPNVGKSTLLSKITGAKPEINEYAFTTKTLNIGYFEHLYSRIQIIDTPGTLDRPEKMNTIERQAYLALKYCAHMIIYVFDPTEEYPIALQKALFLKVRRDDIPIFIYISKTDLLENDQIEEVLRRADFEEVIVTKYSEVKEKIIDAYKKSITRKSLNLQ